jgi:hypothetical protein
MSARTRARSTTKIESKNSLYPHTHFTWGTRPKNHREKMIWINNSRVFWTDDLRTNIGFNYSNHSTTGIEELQPPVLLAEEKEPGVEDSCPPDRKTSSGRNELAGRVGLSDRTKSQRQAWVGPNTRMNQRWKLRLAPEQRQTVVDTGRAPGAATSSSGREQP